MTDKKDEEGFWGHPYGDVFASDFDKFQIHDNNIWSNNFQQNNEYQNYENSIQSSYCDENSFIPPQNCSNIMHSGYNMIEVNSIGAQNERHEDFSMMSYENIHGMMNYDPSYNQNFSMIYRQPISSPDINQHPMYMRMRSESGSASPVKLGYMSPIKSIPSMHTDELTLSPQLYNQKGIKKQYGVSTTARMLGKWS